MFIMILAVFFFLCAPYPTLAFHLTYSSILSATWDIFLVLWIPIQSWMFLNQYTCFLPTHLQTSIFPCKIQFQNSYWSSLIVCFRYNSSLYLTTVVSSHPNLALLKTWHWIYMLSIKCKAFLYEAMFWRLLFS